MRNRNQTPVELLTEYMQNSMMDSGGVGTLGLYLDLVVEIEKDAGMIFTDSEILKCYWAAADYVCDSYRGNAYDTPIENGFTEQDREKELARCEAMRPSVKRRLELETKFKGV